ncbi:MAG: hypothetical protein QHJ34_09720 [bacterium]|jgi:hypothetical protein|nr:hypothetical protein [candidate division KSB1 bacterium]MDH7560495.1 hypothetical protein [bacterium]
MGLVVLFSSLCAATHLWARIDRPYEPTVVAGDSLLAAAMLPVADVRLWAYRAEEDQWQAIPFQIDEVNPRVRPWDRYFVAEDSLLGILDLDDELVLMARDLGDRADSTQWPATGDSLRFELAFFDSLDGTMGYAYLYWQGPQTGVPNPYGLAYDSLQDRVSNTNYQVGFNATGQLADVVISREVGGSGVDLFDRFKVRAIGSFLIFPIYMDEELIRAEQWYARVGPVRIIRNLNGRFQGKIALVDVDQPFTQTVFFYPYSGSFELAALPLEQAKDLGVTVSVLRASWDMSPSAAGMRFYSARNTAGVPVDGIKDQVDPACSPGQLNWTLVTGAAGTMVNLFHVPQLGDRIGLYYYDATDGKTADGSALSKDTGDMLSYGDNGFLLSGNIQNYFAPGATFSVVYRNYFLPPGFSPEQAARLCEQAAHPLRVTVSLQRRWASPSAVAASSNEGPAELALAAYPNPVHATTVLSFRLARRSRVVLEVYDVAGRCMARIVDEELPPGLHHRPWYGRDGAGRQVPSGLYFARLAADGAGGVTKLLLVR